VTTIHVIHPSFTPKGGAEKLILDMKSWLSETFHVKIHSLFGPKALRHSETLLGSNPIGSALFGYKAHPFIRHYSKKLANTIATQIRSDDIIIISNFPASLVYSELLLKHPNIHKTKAYFLCFEPDRLLYFQDSIKYGFLPPDIINFSNRVASNIIRMHRNADQKAVAKCKKIITFSNFVSSQAEKIYPVPKPIKIAEHYIDSEPATGRRKSTIENILGHKVKEKSIILLSVGRLEPGKGLLDLLNQFSYLVKDDKDIHLVIGGTGSLEKQIRKTSASIPNTHILGFVSDDDLMTLYESSHIFVFLGSKETGGPLTVIEAMYYGLITIVPSDGGAAYEIIKSGKNGLVTNLDETSVQKTLRFAIQQVRSGQSKAISLQAIDWVKQHALKDIVAKDTVNFFTKEALK